MTLSTRPRVRTASSLPLSAAGFAAVVLAISALSSPVAAAAVALARPPSAEAIKLSGECAGQRRLTVAGADIRLQFEAADYALGPAAICAWVAQAALNVGNYFRRFPVARVRIAITAVDAGKVATGATYGAADGGPLIVIKLGRHADQASLDRDWVMTHEFVHLAVPSVPDRSHWLEEGIATYVEPIARVELGQLTAGKVWSDLLRDLPQGLPRAGDRGLDHTPTWGRTYWGGALFCLLADVEIRRRSDNRKSLRDALRGVLAAGGNIEHDWSAAQVFAAGDQAIGMTVLADLYRGMSATPGMATLDKLWQQLGVARGRDDTVHYAADAPLAAVRAAIMSDVRQPSS